jgi:hypothetical protein
MARADVMFRINSENLSNKVAWAGVGGNLLSVNLPRTIRFSIKTNF